MKRKRKEDTDKLTAILKTKDVFIEPYLDSYLVYVPLYGLALLCNLDTVNAIKFIQKKKDILPFKLEALCMKITSLGIDLKQLKQRTFKIPSDYKPTEAMLSLTSSCNLRCSYCYIKGGDSDRKLSWEIAKSAIDYVYSTAISLCRDEFTLSFHGEGEPSTNWTLLKRCVHYAKEKAKKGRLNLKVYMSTNCLLNEEQIKFIKKNFHSISASFDILKDVQNFQRPLKNGKGSFEQVFRTLRSFDKDSFPYGIRATVTQHNLYRLEESLDFVAANLSTNQVQFDPVCSYGRSYETGVKDVAPMEFVNQFRKARIAAAHKRIRVSYSGCRPYGISYAFCGAEGGNFAVSTDGWISTCFEVLSPNDPRSKFLIIGHYDKNQQQFILYKEKIMVLLNRTPYIIEDCKKCFAKWNCGGECVAKILHNTPNDMNSVIGSARCIINRELLKDEIVAGTLLETLKNRELNIN